MDFFISRSEIPHFFRLRENEIQLFKFLLVCKSITTHPQPRTNNFDNNALKSDQLVNHFGINNISCALLIGLLFSILETAF